MANGITIGTNYRVYAVQKVQTVAGEIVQLVHLKVSREHRCDQIFVHFDN